MFLKDSKGSDCFSCKIKSFFKDLLWFFYALFYLRKKVSFVKRFKGLSNDRAVDKGFLILPLLEMNHFQVFHLLILAKAMESRGYRVVVIVCDSVLPGCEIKSCSKFDSKAACVRCSSNRLFLLPYFKFEQVCLSDIIKCHNPVFDYRDKGFVSDSVARYFYGGQECFPESIVNIVSEKHKSTSAISRYVGKFINENYGGGIVLNNMNVYSQWGPLFDEVDDHRFKKCVLSNTPFDLNCVRFNILDLFRSQDRYERFVSTRDSSFLSKDEISILEAFLDKRKSGKDSLFEEWDYFSDGEGICFDEGKRNVVLFPNIPWDVGLNEFTGVYENVYQWIEDTIVMFQSDPSITLWIKVHPGEVKGTSPSKATVYDWLVNRSLPKNVKLIEPETNLSPYHLFDVMDVGVVFSGTLGLEMLNSGIPVVSAGLPPYHGLPFGLQPKTRTDYQEMISHGKFDPDEIDSIRLYSYFYFIYLSKSWPFTKRAFGDKFDGYVLDDVNHFVSGKNEDVDYLCRLVEKGGLD